MILLTALAMTSCQPQHGEGREEAWGGRHPYQTGAQPSDTFWNSNVNTFLVIPTVAAIIVDSKGVQVPQSGVIVSANFGLGSVLRNSTNANGATTIPILGLLYPVTFTATDNGVHKFSVVRAEAPPLPSPIKIVESASDSIVTKTTSIK